MKLAEADYFLGRMQAVANEPVAFKYELSAFLAAARSVLQYACAESKDSNASAASKAWYDGQVTGKAVVRFFKDKRDISIHHTPIVPRTDASIAVHDVARVSETVSIQVVHEDGTVEPLRTFTSEPVPPVEPPAPTVTYTHYFSDWPGSEDILTLCAAYLSELRAIVADGVAKGFLTP